MCLGVSPRLIYIQLYCSIYTYFLCNNYHSLSDTTFLFSSVNCLFLKFLTFLNEPFPSFKMRRRRFSSLRIFKSDIILYGQQKVFSKSRKKNISYVTLFSWFLILLHFDLSLVTGFETLYPQNVREYKAT